MFKERFIQAPTEELYEAKKENISDESIVFHEETDTISVGDINIQGIPIPDNDTLIGSVLLQTDEGLEWKYNEIEEEVVETVIRINLTIDDPYKMITGHFGKDGTPSTNVVSWIRANSHRYVGTWNATDSILELKLLDDNDGRMYADGTNALSDLQFEAGKNVFVKLPTFWYKGAQPFSHTEDITDVYFRRTKPDDETGWMKWNEKRLIGAFFGSLSNAKLFSLPCVSDSHSINHLFSYLATCASNQGTGFTYITYNTHKILSLLYIGYYGNTNPSTTIGDGANPSNTQNVGAESLKLGMRDSTGTLSNGDINFWGVCDPYGRFEEIMDGMLMFYNSDGVGGFYKLNQDDGIGYEEIPCPTWTSDLGVPDRLILGPRLHFIAKSYSSKYNTNFNVRWCERVLSTPPKQTNFHRFFTRGYLRVNGLCGNIWQYWGNCHINDTTTNAGTRLEYCGPIKIIN